MSRILGEDWKQRFAELCQTEAFKRRDKEWPFESWDYTEWEECLAEINNGAVPKRRKTAPRP